MQKYLLLLLMEPCSVFYPVILFCSDVDVQFSHRHFGGCPNGLRFSIFCDFCKAVITHSVYMISSCLLILVHLMTSRISQMLRILSRKVLPGMHFKVLTSVVLSVWRYSFPLLFQSVDHYRCHTSFIHPYLASCHVLMYSILQVMSRK